MTKHRTLTEEEQRLWDLANKSTMPLRSKQHSPLPRQIGQSVLKIRMPERRSDPAKTVAPVRQPMPIDRRTVSKLGRGRLSLDARLDLHGLYQDQAYARLSAFIAECRVRRYRYVLIITGKGTSKGDPGAAGILRRQVPKWLGAPPLAADIVSIDFAHRNHGGTGAYYVTLRTKQS